jgi:hypothetical protein
MSEFVKEGVGYLSASESVVLSVQCPTKCLILIFKNNYDDILNVVTETFKRVHQISIKIFIQIPEQRFSKQIFFMITFMNKSIWCPNISILER